MMTRVLAGVLLVAGVAVAEAAEGAKPAAEPAKPHRRLVLEKPRIGFDDGDSIEYAFTEKDGLGLTGKIELRLLGFDSPETAHPHHGIFCDQHKGQEASALTRRLIEKARRVELLTRGDRDPYNRLLAYVFVDGRSLAVLQIEAGLAYEAVLFFGDNGFPEQYKEVLDAWNNRSPINKALKAKKAPAFRPPHAWRTLYQKPQNGKEIPLAKWNAMSAEEKAQRVKESGCLAD